MPDESASAGLRGPNAMDGLRGPNAMTVRPFADVRWFDEVDSTNSVAADLVRRGDGAPGLVVVADHQRSGRGRRGRRWEAPPGSSLLASVVLPPSTPDRPAHLATMAMALAASDACADIAAVTPLLKWPNDLVVEGRKLGGILGEASDTAVVVGLGLNVNWASASADVAPPNGAVSLDELAAAAGPFDRQTLLHAVLRHFDLRLTTPADQLVDAFRARSATVGQRVRVELATGTVEGLATAISAHGHLLVDEDGGARHVIAAGDVVHVRPGAAGTTNAPG